MTLLDRRFIHRKHAGAQEDNVVVPPIDVTIPPPPVPVDPPDPVDPPVIRGNQGQQRSAYVHARNAARQELHGKTAVVTSADPTKVRIDKIEGTQVFLTVLDESAIIQLTGTVDAIAIPNILVTGPTTPVNPVTAKILGDWDAEHLTDNGTKVLTLVDKSQKGNSLAQTTDANRIPLSSVVIVNGKQVLQFGGSAFYTLDPLNSGTIPPRDNIALITIVKPTAVIQKVAIQVGTDGTAKGIALSPDTSSGVFGGLINGVAFEDTDQAVDSTNRQFYLMNRSGTVTRYYKNGKPIFPIGGNLPGSGYTKVSIPGADHIMAGDWRLGTLANALTETEIYNLTKFLVSTESITDSSVDPSTIYAADDDFTFGASIDAAGNRRVGATAWTAKNAGGSLTNAISGGQLILTLPQAASDIFRGFTQPDPNVDDTTYSYWIAKIIPASIGAQNGHKAALACIQNANDRMLALTIGFVGGVRQIGIERHFNISAGGDFDGYQSSAQATGFSSADWDEEWTLHIAWNKTVLNCWYQIGTGATQSINNVGGVSTGFFNNGLRADKLGLLVSSGNATGGDTIGVFTDLKRML